MTSSLPVILNLVQNLMQEKLTSLKETALSEIKSVSNQKNLEKLRIKYLGRQGEITKLTKRVGELPEKERREIGQLINKLKSDIEEALERKADQLTSRPTAKLSDWLDITVPGKKPPTGHLHPVTQAIFEIEEIFSRLGFVRRRYPEVELDYYAFEALNMPKDQPARDEFETFYITDEIILTPHTSSGQIREMLHTKGIPIRMINIAKCYRPNWDASHTPMFHQFEGLLIDRNVSIADLKGVFDFFVKNFFGPKREIRLRPWDFRFTEPSFEVDITCDVCQGRGCRLCKEGWLELGGAGMVHPEVIKNGGLDPKKVNGFAFGWGVERTWMMKAGLKIPDLRILYQNDLRFLEQF